MKNLKTNLKVVKARDFLIFAIFSYGDIFFYVDFIEIASLDKNFNYDNVYVEGDYE